MRFEHQQTTVWHSWPESTDITQSDTYPVHVDWKPKQAEPKTVVAETICATEFELNMVNL